MNSDYVAWNGERYVWPPPEGWYLASDGRWWAPDTGPDIHLDPGPGESAPGAEVGVGHQIDANVHRRADHVGPVTGVDPTPEAGHGIAPETHDPDRVAGAGLFPDPGATPDLDPAQAWTPEFDSTVAYEPDFTEPPASDPLTQPAVSRPVSDQVAAVADTGATTAMAADVRDSRLDPTMAMAEPPGTAAGPHPVVAADPETGGHERVPILEPTDARSPAMQRSRTMPMVAAGLLAAAAIVIAALLSLLGGDDDTQAPQPSASAEETDGGSEELVVSTDDSTTLTPDDGTTDDGTMDDGTMDDGTMDDEGQEATATTAAVSTGGTENAALIGRFRTLLEDNQITAAALTGDDLVVFGQTACSYATSSADLPQYEQIRDEALDGAQNDELSIGELKFVVDTAVTVFCAEDATRLGLSPRAPAGG